MRRSYDVVIAGGGVIGSAVAYWLSADPDFDGSVLVVEPDPTYAACATTRSWGGLRQQFSHPDNIRMSMFGIEFARRAAEVLAVDGEGPDLGFHENGYLFLASEDGLAVLRRNVETQTSLGCVVELMAPDALAEAVTQVHEAPGPLLAVFKVRAEELPLVLPPKEGELLKARFREALLGAKAGP